MKNTVFKSTLAIFAAITVLLTGISARNTAAEEDKNWHGFTAVSTKEELNAVRDDLNGKYYLTQDIVFTPEDFAEGGDFYNGGTGWQPIGNFETRFRGIFDGNGHTIEGLYINVVKEPSNIVVFAGLFGNSAGTIRNLGMINGSVNSESTRVGGLVGSNWGNISHCYTRGVSCSSSSDADMYLGGIAGNSDGKGIIEGCYNESELNISVSRTSPKSNIFIGGIVGMNIGSIITNCYNTGSITVNGINLSQSICLGGIAGYSFAYSIINCYNAGELRTDNSNAHVGGIVGHNFSKIINCFNSGSVNASSSFVDVKIEIGGITGHNNIYIGNCYNVGNVMASLSADGVFTGGVSGYHDDSYVGENIENCCCLNNTQKLVGNWTDTTGVYTEEQMRQRDAFAEFDFDFDVRWQFDGDEAYPYPKLFPFLYGDLNYNGEITAADALIVLQYAVEKTALTADQKLVGDVLYGSGLTADDALLILQYSVGKINSFWRSKY